MRARNTIVMTGDVLADLADGRYIVGRWIDGEDVMILARHVLGLPPVELEKGEVVVLIGRDGMTVDKRPQGVRFGGHLPGPDGTTVDLHAVRVVDHRLRLFIVDGDAVDQVQVFDRQIRAFGPAGQELLRHLRVGVVGAGGTGSAVAEQLIRLGVGTILTIDDDVVSEDGSNVTRIYGSMLADRGSPKVDIVKRTADRVGLDTDVIAVRGTVNDVGTARLLRRCDVVFGCTDDNRGRVTLSRLAYWYLTPLIDMGVQLDSDGTTLRSIDGRITYVGPGAPCLFCRGRINQTVLQAELLPADEREARIAERYAIGLPERDPAVIAYTTAVAALGVAELLNRLFAVDATPAATEMIVQFHLRRIGTNRRAAIPGHWCSQPANLAAGDAEPFLGLTWRS